MMPVSMMMPMVHAEDVAVVGCAAGCVGEDGVGLGEEGEGVRGVWVGGIGVGMVSFGEGVEGSEVLLGNGFSLCLIRTHFLISAGVASCRTFSRS